MIELPTIHELAAQAFCQTDKQNPTHAFQGLTYLHIYERYFEARRESAKRVLEIGVLRGDSVRLWRDYFPNASIVGLDIDPAVCGQEDRITIIHGDQSNPDDLARVSQHGPFDVIVDDGSHISCHMVASFNGLWGSVVPSGLYCMEDMRCTYHGADGQWPGMKYNKAIPPNGDRQLIDDLLKRLVTDMDNLTGEVRAIHIHPMQLIIEKV